MKSLVTFLLIAAVALGSIAIHLWHQRVADHEHIAALQVSLEQATTAAVAAEPGPVASEMHTPSDEEAPSRPHEPAASIGAVSPDPSAKAAHGAPLRGTATRALLGSPENIERMRTLARARVPSEYPDVGQALGLSAEEESQLYDLLAQHEANAVRDLDAHRTSGETRSQFAARQLRANEDEISAMLGGKYFQWKAYQEELPSRRQVKDLDVVLRASGTPLNDIQARSLVSALISAQERIHQLGGPIFSPEKRQALVDAASYHLSSDQLEAYRQMLERQQGTGSLPMFLGVPSSPNASAEP